MIFDRLENKSTYYSIHPLFEAAFRFIEKCAEEPISPGRYEIMGIDVYAMVQEYTSSTPEIPRLETHDKYIDIQCMLKGSEHQHHAPRSELMQTVQYNSDADITIYSCTENCSNLKLDTGCFVIYFPQDGHMPSIPDEHERRCQRVVVKVKC